MISITLGNDTKRSYEGLTREETQEVRDVNKGTLYSCPTFGTIMLCSYDCKWSWVECNSLNGSR